MVKVSCCGLVKDTHSMLKNRKVCYPNGNLMFKATLSPQSVYVPSQRDPSAKIQPLFVLYCMFPLVAFNHRLFNVNSA